MKQIFSILGALSFMVNVTAQSPNRMSYQAVVRDSSNVLVTNHAVGMQISILQGSASGSAVYVETQTATSNDNGLVSIEIGGGTTVSGTLDFIDWGNGPYFVKTETDPDGGNNYSISGTSQLLSVPYALYAKNAGTITGDSCFKHYIGEKFGGGVIFHLWKDTAHVEHGLIIDLVDLNKLKAWSNVTSAFGGTEAQSSWNGLGNSNDITAQAGHTSSAASLCLNSVNGGQSDWYLPSIHELNMLWNNYYTVARALSQIAGATEISFKPYWSSTVSALTTYPYALYFYTGDANYSNTKDAKHYVRAVRAF
jgi:hypothetical protein